MLGHEGRHEIKDLPIGITAEGERTETDSIGGIKVPASRYWGAQTQRSLIHFSIGNDRMPKEVYHAYGVVKKAAALVNQADGRLEDWKASVITRVADEVIAAKLDEHFPLYVWQTGSGAQSNMNLNEVIANRAIQLLGGELGSKAPVHPDDDVNMGMSPNDSFPTAMHVAAVRELDEHLLPQLDRLARVIEVKATDWMDVVKIGRTHLEEAAPLTVGQEWSGYAHQLRDTMAEVRHARIGLMQLAIGGAAVGTGLNAPAGFSTKMAAKIAELTGQPYITAPNKFAAQGSLDAMVRATAALRGVAVALMKVANDLRWLAPGPRCGLGELLLPENEPGSPVTPVKVSSTQCEAIVMIAIQVIGDDNAVAVAGSQGNFELNAMRPIIINNFLHSARILADGSEKFRVYSVEGAKLNENRTNQYVQDSVMLVSALSPVIGYDKANRIAQTAIDDDLTLKQAALQSGEMTEVQFDQVVDVRKMAGNGLAGA